MNVDPGDWACWMCNNTLVIGRVIYVMIPPRYGYTKQAYTTCGMVDLDCLLEVRKPESSK